MANSIRINLKQIEAFANKLGMSMKEVEISVEEFLLEMAFRFEAKVKNLTPVAEVDGGTLRRNWKVGSVSKRGKSYFIEVYNNTEYAAFVEFGHRQTPGRFVPGLGSDGKGRRLKANWVEGRFMATISVEELTREMPKHIRNFETVLAKRISR